MHMNFFELSKANQERIKITLQVSINFSGTILPLYLFLVSENLRSSPLPYPTIFQTHTPL